MRPERLVQNLHLHEWVESLLPDFILAFVFFTSLSYAVLGKRFDRQRPAIAMSTAIGFALSIGLVWWEQANDLSVKNLGPIAIGFAIVVLALVIYKSIRQVGGSWAGAGIALGACIIIARLLQLNVPIDSEVIQSITVVALVIGILAFLYHTRGHTVHLSRMSTHPPGVRHNMNDLYRDRHLSSQLGKKMRQIRRQADTLSERPEEASDILVQLKRILPAEGYLTERMSQLRAKAHSIRNGHIARLDETRAAFAKLPTSTRKKAAAQLAARYNQIVGIDTRLERLDKAVAETERRIRELTARARQHTARYEHQKLIGCLKAAEKLQRHNSRLFKIIERTENKLSATAKKIASEVKRIEK